MSFRSILPNERERERERGGSGRLSLKRYYSESERLMRRSSFSPGPLFPSLRLSLSAPHPPHPPSLESAWRPRRREGKGGIPASVAFTRGLNDCEIRGSSASHASRKPQRCRAAAPHRSPVESHTASVISLSFAERASPVCPSRLINYYRLSLVLVAGSERPAAT